MQRQLIRTLRLAALPAFLFGLGSCASTSQREVDLGSVPLAFVEIYDVAAEDGIIEVEIDRDGRVREIEADVPVELIPAVVADAVMRHLPAGRVTGGERELTTKGEAWEVKLDVEGMAWEVVVDDRGRIIETEQQIDHRTAPTAVMDTVQRSMPQGLLLSVELIRRGDEEEYHVKKERYGASYKLVVAPDGRLLRKVREARAEIEIPVLEP